MPQDGLFCGFSMGIVFTREDPLGKIRCGLYFFVFNSRSIICRLFETPVIVNSGFRGIRVWGSVDLDCRCVIMQVET